MSVLIFDQLNDLVFIRVDEKFEKSIKEMAITQGLLQDHQSALDNNIVVQLFSPLVTSQRIMATQFNNPYTAVTCQDGTTIVFQEYAGFFFIGIGDQEEAQLQRIINVTISIVQLIVGPCVSVLKSSMEKTQLLDSLIGAWQQLFNKEQSYLVEAVERLVVNSELSVASVKVLSAVIDRLKSSKEITPCHAIFFVRNKLLGLYSSRNAHELSASDLLNLNLLVEARNYRSANRQKSTISVPIIPTSPDGQEDEEQDGAAEQGKPIRNTILMLRTDNAILTPHLVHFNTISNGLSLVLVSEVGRTQLAGQLTSLLRLLEDVTQDGTGGHGKFGLEACEAAIRKSQELAKRLPKSTATERVEKTLNTVYSRWDSLKRSGLEDWLKTGGEVELPSKVEAALTALVEASRTAWRAVSLGVSSTIASEHVQGAIDVATEKMAPYCHFLEAKALRNLTLGCRSTLTINKYLEEFPGLVHFLYVDRSTHQLTAPTFCVEHLDQEGDNNDLSPPAGARALTTTKVWSMVEFAHSHLSKGHLSLIWKDTTFNYAYFLWFEDHSGNPLKPGPIDEEILDCLPSPGILCEDFYNALTALVFPGTDPSRIRIYELFCIHLGLATSPCILEHTRRLAATIWEVTGPSSTNPADLL